MPKASPFSKSDTKDGFSLEDDAKPLLQDAGNAGGGGDGTECSAGRRDVRRAEGGVIEHVERLESILNLDSFAGVEVLKDGRIQVVGRILTSVKLRERPVVVGSTRLIVGIHIELRLVECPEILP